MMPKPPYQILGQSKKMVAGRCVLIGPQGDYKYYTRNIKKKKSYIDNFCRSFPVEHFCWSICSHREYNCNPNTCRGAFGSHKQSSTVSLLATHQYDDSSNADTPLALSDNKSAFSRIFSAHACEATPQGPTVLLQGIHGGHANIARSS
jgi:hypothetical protein